MTESTPPKKSDLGVRTLSAVVMVAVAGTALWLGGWVWTAFVALVALGVLWEWWGLVAAIAGSVIARVFWCIGGLIYVGTAAFNLGRVREIDDGFSKVLLIVGLVIAVDVGAYFAGRTFGGPKIAPRISPSKTWSGWIGGSVGAAAYLFAMTGVTCGDANFAWVELSFQSMWNCLVNTGSLMMLLFCLPVGFVIASVAQTGDFFESWMKRRAGVKDSGAFIPGHGGLFDRVDGLLAVSFVHGLISLPIVVGHQ